MRNWQLLIPLIAVAVWILSSLIRGAGDRRVRRPRPPVDPGDQRPPPEPSKPRRSAGEVDRFLQEVQRRRRDTGERRPEPLVVDAPEVIPMATLVPPPPPPPAPRATGSRAERKLRRRQAETAAIPVIPAMPAAPAVGWQEPAPAAPSPGVAETAANQSLGREVRSLLRSPQTVRAALVLREILDQPLSRRRPG